MANLELVSNFQKEILDLERLVEVWKNLRCSHLNFETISDLITQKLVGLGALCDNDMHGTSLKGLGRLIGIRNTMVELDSCSVTSYGEYWSILDALLKMMITFLSARNTLDTTSDLRCLETLEEWTALNFQMMQCPLTSLESNALLDDVVFMGLRALREVFEKGLVVKDDTNSMRVLEIAAELRDTLRPQFHKCIDKIIAQKLRILSIHQTGKSDVSGNHIRSYYTAAHN